MLALTAALYWPGLDGPALLDDRSALGAFLDASSFPTDWKAFVISNTGPLGRPLSMLTFIANLYWSGNDLWAWKATNLALHLGLGCVLFLIARTLLSIAPLSSGRAQVLALLIASTWLIHPLQVSTVLYTVQRMTQLSALFTALGILTYLVARQSQEDDLRARLSLWSVYLVFTPLAAFSKENGLLLPVYLAMLEFTVLRGIGLPALRRHAHWLLLALLALPCVIGTLYVLIHFDQAIWQPHLRRGFTVWERLLTEGRVLARYLIQIIAPSGSRLGFFHDDIPLSTALFSPPTTALSLLFLVSIMTWACRAATRLPLVSCGVLWFFVGHSMEAGIVPLELMFEHRNYLPSFGILLAIVSGLQRLQWTPSKRLALTSGVIVLALFSVVTRSIVNDWRKEQSMIIAFYRAHPNSERAVSQMVELLMAYRRYDTARAALVRLPGAGPEIHRWLLECQQHGTIPDQMLDSAVVSREKALSSYAVAGLLELSKLGLDDACRFSAVRFRELLERAMERPTVILPNRQKLTVYAAHYAWKLGDGPAAFARLEDALVMATDDPIPAFLMSEWKLDRGDVEGGSRAFVRGEAIAKRSGRDFSQTIASVRELVEKKRSAPH